MRLDCYLRLNSAFATQQWIGRRLATLGLAGAVVLARAEDVILMKLVYYAEGHSDQHLRDMAGIVAVQQNALDNAYLARWAAALGVSAIWDQVRLAS